MALKSRRRRNTDSGPPAIMTFPLRLFRLLLPRGLKLAALALVVAPLAANDGPPPVSLKVSPETIEMRSFYNGATVSVDGTAPAGSDVLVVVRGNQKDEFFNRKGRVGPIWVNADKLKISGAPSLFLSFSSRDVNSMLNRSSIEKDQLDEKAIISHIQCEAESGPPDAKYLETIRDNYLKLKAQEGSYHSSPGSVKLDAAANGSVNYHLEIPWPRKAPPGSYQIEVYACRNGTVIGSTTTALGLVEVGFPAFMAALARDHSLLYGLVAVLAASIAGFGINALAKLLEPKKKVPGEGIPAPAPQPEKAAAAKASAGGKEHQSDEREVHRT